MRDGAKAPAGKPTASLRPKGKITDEDRKHWSFQPVKNVAPPEADDPRWNRTEIDRYAYAALRKAGLTPAPKAEKETLLRRLTFDVIGLPPTEEETAAFVADLSPTAYESAVDRLLARREHGEHAARAWLDVARYAESDGFKADDYRPEAWRYRDYVIRSINADKPFDRFLVEQLAGDERWPNDPEALLATSFLRLGVYEYNNRDVRGQWNDILNELVDVTGDAVLGMGFACARCHDHKYDAILQRDYYQMRAFFAAYSPRDDAPICTPEELGAAKRARADWEKRTAKQREELAKLVGKDDEKAIKDAIDRFPEDIQAIMRKPAAARTPLETQLADLAERQVQFDLDHLDTKMKGAKKDRYLALRKEIGKPPAPPAAPIATDVGKNAPETTLATRPDTVPPKPPSVLVAGEFAIPAVNTATTGRRSALADWVVSPNNPLTARVAVNRVWQQYFGRGIAGTASDFGTLGERPTHPELLDRLTAEFISEGWSLKKLRRKILLSEFYQQSSTHPAPTAALAKDPENRLLWRAANRRLSAEQIRDSLMAAAGTLDRAAGGPSADFGSTRRTIYVKVLRNRKDGLLEVFDAPDNLSSVALRNRTTTPLQALYLFNGARTRTAAEQMAARAAKGAADSAAAVRRAYRLAFSRSASESEVKEALAYLGGEGAGSNKPSAAFVGFNHVLLNANEFVYVD